MEKTIEDAIANYYQLKKNYEDKMNAKKMKNSNNWRKAIALRKTS